MPNWQNFKDYVAPSAKLRLIYYLKLDNENRRLMNEGKRVAEKTLLMILPEDATETEPENYYNENMWNNAPLAGCLRSSGIKTRGAGHNLTGQGLLLRLRQVMEGTAPDDAFELNWYGENKKEFYLPIASDFLTTFALVFGTIYVVHYLYGFCEQYSPVHPFTLAPPSPIIIPYIGI